MDSGHVRKYDWVESTSFGIGELLLTCPEVVLGKVVVISSFDSGPLTLSPEEIASGWRKVGDLAISGQISSVSELPFDNYDEWYVFPQHTGPEISDTFVNDGIFRLVEPEQFIWNAVAVVGRQADLVGAKYLANQLAERQLIFWEQIESCAPESFIAAGNTFMFVTRNVELFAKVMKAISDTE